ncbi:hypothetical protein [Streptomyces sp. NPDC001205]
MTEADIAERMGLTLHAWRMRHAVDFRARVKVMNPEERLKLYDEEQALAFIAGRPIPPRPESFAPQPGDLLNVRAASVVLGVSQKAVRAYGKTGGLDEGEERHGHRWWRRATVMARLEAKRHQSERTGVRRSVTAAREAEVAAELARAAAGRRPDVTEAELAERYGVSTRTAQRLLVTARRYGTTQESPTASPS